MDSEAATFCFCVLAMLLWVAWCEWTDGDGGRDA